MNVIVVNLFLTFSHELRTPLTSMRSYIETLSEGAWQDQEIAPRFFKNYFG